VAGGRQLAVEEEAGVADDEQVAERPLPAQPAPTSASLGRRHIYIEAGWRETAGKYFDFFRSFETKDVKDGWSRCDVTRIADVALASRTRD
jgi:hypothetical protein